MVAESASSKAGLHSLRRRGRMRRIFLRIHQIIGLFAGAIFVLVGLSGGVLAFREDIDESLNAAIMRVEAPAQASLKPLNEILAAAVAAMPPDAKLERLTLPRHAKAAAAVTYMVESDDLESDFYQLFVDPYTAQVKGRRLLLHGDKTFSQPFIQILMVFHWTLLFGANNAYIVGSLGILLFFSVLIGFYLWLSANGRWDLGFKVKWRATRERVVYDLHRSVGIYGAAILLTMLFTGAAMIFKPATRGVTTLFSPVRPDPDFGRSKPIPNGAPIGLDAAVAAANKVFPDGRTHWVLLPSTPTGVYVVGKQSKNEPNRTKTFRNVGVDQYSGEVLHVQDRGDFTAGERFLEWLFPLHSGEAFGEIGRPLTLLIGLIPLTLYVTGFLRWRQRRRGRGPPAF
jgi:uncharacterized iron-regulated membrane protein